MNNKQLARVLRTAMPLYTNEMRRNTAFMCITLKEMAYDNQITMDECRCAQDRIMDRIKPCYTLIEYLRNRADHSTHKTPNELKEDAVQFFREWIEILESS